MPLRFFSSAFENFRKIKIPSACHYIDVCVCVCDSGVAGYMKKKHVPLFITYLFVERNLCLWMNKKLQMGRGRWGEEIIPLASASMNHLYPSYCFLIKESLCGFPCGFSVRLDEFLLIQ